MIGFKLTEEQVALQRLARDFAKNEIRPVAAELDRIPDPKANFPWDIYIKGNKLGFNSALIPQEYGGLGYGDLDMAIVTEELGWGDAGVGTTWGAHWLAARPIISNGTEAQKKEWLGKITSDPTGTFLFGLAATEHGSAGDSTPRGFMGAAERTGFGGLTARDFVTNKTVPAIERREATTYAREDGDFYVINGLKRFITNGSVAKAYNVAVTFDRNKPDVLSSGSILVSADTPGVSFGTIENKMGHRLSRQAEVVFDEVRVPKGNRLLPRDPSLPPAPSGLATTNMLVGALSLGLARAAYEAAREYACVRYKGGNLIVFHEAVGLMLADMAIAIETARLLVWHAAWHNDNVGSESNLPGMAKVYCSDIAMKATMDAVQIFGGYGYMREFPVEKYMRDAKLTQIYDGTNEVLRLGYILRQEILNG